jgi:hypothetical protein
MCHISGIASLGQINDKQKKITRKKFRENNSNTFNLRITFIVGNACAPLVVKNNNWMF